MRSRFLCLSALLAWPGWFLLQGQSAETRGAETPRPPVQQGGDFSTELHPVNKVPSGVIIVKGAWYSASDSTTPVPEDGNVTDNVFSDKYFGISYALPADWIEKYKGPPPSPSGLYVLAQVKTGDKYKGPAKASMLITAQDMFFVPPPSTTAREMVGYTKSHLVADYKAELPLTQTTLAGHPFTFFAYWSPAAELHWYMMATEIRCHTVEIVISSRDTKALGDMFLSLNKMTLPGPAGSIPETESGAVPLCLKDHARTENMIARVEPVFSEKRFNSVPVRIVIDKEGKVKHIHFLSAFPDQSRAITDALQQWRFKPYLQDGKPVEVETGILFGRSTFAPSGPAVITSATQ